jgi:hypothetical protein
MKGAVPKTGHQTILNRSERLVFRTMAVCKHAGLLRDWQAEHVENHGTTRPRIELRPHTRTGWKDFSIEMRVLYCDGTRFITGVLGEGVTVDQFQQALKDALDKKTGLDVLVKCQGDTAERLCTADHSAQPDGTEAQEVVTQNVQEATMAKPVFSHTGSPDADRAAHKSYTLRHHDLKALDPDGTKWAQCTLIYECVMRVRELEGELHQLKCDTLDSLQTLLGDDDDSSRG